MTSKDRRAAVERLMTDPEFARRAYEDPEKVLPIEYDLDPAQWQAVHRALEAEVDDAEDEVAGFQMLNWSGRQNFPHLLDLVSPRDAATGQTSGKRQHKPVTFTQEADKAWPTFF
jgi:hypothetical protein